MRANVTLKLCANDIHFCAQMKTVRKRNFSKMCANVIAPVFQFKMVIEHVREKTNNLGFRPGPIDTRPNSHRRWLEA